MHHQSQGVIIPTIKPRNRTVADIIPVIIPILLAIFQMILSFVILALESVSVYYDAGRGTVYAGFWCSTVFLVSWIAMFCYICCRKSMGCGIYLVVQNIINIIFVIILIVFTSRFINNPCLCYGVLCKIPPGNDLSEIYSVLQYGTDGYGCSIKTIRKVPVLKGLLSCAVLLLVSNLIFIIVFIIAWILLRRKSVPTFAIPSTAVLSYPPPSMIHPSNQHEPSFLTSTIPEAHYYSPTIETAPHNEMPSAPFEIRSYKF